MKKIHCVSIPIRDLMNLNRIEKREGEGDMPFQSLLGI